MITTKIFAAMLCAAMLGATGALAQRSNPCDPRYHFITPADCTTYGEQAAKHMGELREAIAEENVRIAEARKRFWETYPDKPGAAEARDEFGKRLYGKDFHYLYIILTDALGGVKTVDLIGGKLDGGIPRYAIFEFNAWVEEIKFNLGEKSVTDALLKNPVGLEDRLRKAVKASEKKHAEYLFERDWAEFDAAGREPAGMDDPARYFQTLCMRSQKISWEEARAEFDGLVKALGKDNVLRAIQQVHAAPKERFGVLKVVTTPEPVKTGPGGSQIEDDTVPEAEGVIGVTAGAIRAVEKLATQGDDRRYLLWLLTEENRPGGSTRIEQATKWQYAVTTYQRLVIAFGEQDVLQASHLVRTATKRATSGDVMDAKAIGATRGVPFASFQDVLARKNPRGYVRSTLIFTEKLDSPAAVDAAYKKLATTDENSLLAAARRLAAGRPNLVWGGELALLKQALNAPSKPETPAETLVDFPEYAGWKKLTPGAKVSYTTRLWQPDRLDPTRLVPGPPKYRYAWQLQSINDEQAKLWSTTTVFTTNGIARPPRDTEIFYPAKAPPIKDQTNTMLSRLFHSQYYFTGATGPKETGTETIVVNGRALAAKWESVTGPIDNGTLTTKTWTSDEIPTRLVRCTEDVAWRPGSQIISRSVMETYLESFEGFAPGEASTGKTEYIPSTAPSTRTVAGNEVTPAPAPKPTPAPVPAQPAPVPVQRTPPPPRIATPPGLPPEAAAQFELAQRNNVVMVRAGDAKRQLAELERTQAGQGIQLPANIRTARDRLDDQLKAVLMAMTKRDNARTEQSLRSAEETVSVIENYLKQ